MNIYTFPPSIRPSNITFTLKRFAHLFDSPLTGETQVVSLNTASRWEAELTYDMLSKEEVRLLSSFLSRMRGGERLFYLHDYSLEIPFGSVYDLNPTPSPVICGVGDTSVKNSGSVLWTKGWGGTADITSLFKVGDYISYRYSTDTNSDLYDLMGMHIITAGKTLTYNGVDLIIDGEDTDKVDGFYFAGLGDTYAVFEIEPSIRVQPVNGSEVFFENCKAVMMLADPDAARWAVSGRWDGNMSFQCLEYVRKPDFGS